MNARRIVQIVTFTSVWGLAVAIAGIIYTCQAGCATQPEPIPAESCAAVCNAGQALGCSWGRPTPNGTPCEEVCELAQKSLGWPLACMARARSCEEAAACR